jgi:hypothetical protein
VSRLINFPAMTLENKLFHHFSKLTRLVFLCGFIASMACVATMNASAKLVIVKAVYGDLSDPAATTNVTTKVAAMVNDDALDVQANNDNFGDPAMNVRKQFKVDYAIDGVAGTKTIFEGGRLRISANNNPDTAHKPGSSRLVIRKAIYGDLPDGVDSDVTLIVAEMVQDDALEVTANNDNFGDPASGIVKKLRVDYTFDGWKKSKTVEEGETLKISPRDEQAQNYMRIWFFSILIASVILTVSAIAAAVVLLKRKWKK